MTAPWCRFANTIELLAPNYLLLLQLASKELKNLSTPFELQLGMSIAKSWLWSTACDLNGIASF